MKTGEPIDGGLVVVDKATGCTSHDVVARMRRIAGTRKVGHAGTLDPAATGVLICGVGRATRLLGHLSLAEKTYEATIRLGETTTTDDAGGETLLSRSARGVTDADVAAGLPALTGTIDQVPSSVSAIKVDGKRIRRVRAGEELKLAPRPVTVTQFDVVARRGDDLDVVVACSSGTYVRALARDLGEALGCGAHLVALRRTRVGTFTLEQAGTLEQLAEHLTLIPLGEAVNAMFARRDLDASDSMNIRHGRPLAPTGVAGPVGVFDPDGQVLALVEDTNDAARPLVVLRPA